MSNQNLKAMTKYVLIGILFIPIYSFSQRFPKFENDTVYTECGFNIFKGQIIHLGFPSGNRKFRFITKVGEIGNIGDCDFIVVGIKKFIVSGLGNHFAYVDGKIVYKDGSTQKIFLKINIDKAIEPFAGLAPEIILPERFKQKLAPKNKLDEIKKLKELFDDSAITKEEYDSLKVKILKQ